MGGKALKGYGVERVDPATYRRISALVLEKVQDIAVRAAIPREMPGKADYGDVDLLVALRPDVGLTQWIQDAFAPRACVSNGGIHSFNVEDLQVDLITTTEESFDVYFAYLCWGDLCMAMGRVARLYELKFGIYGLELPVRDPETNHVVTSILISADPRECFEFLGYDFARWEAGFETEDEVRDFLFSSPLVHQGFLNANSENTKARKRDRMRPAFSRWFKYFEAHLSEFPEASELDIPTDNAALVAYLDERFPDSNLAEKHQRVLQEISDQIAARDKFSGKDILAMFPHLNGPPFGRLMKLWTAQFGSKEEHVQFILSHTREELERRAHEVYRVYEAGQAER